MTIINILMLEFLCTAAVLKNESAYKMAIRIFKCLCELKFY